MWKASREWPHSANGWGHLEQPGLLLLELVKPNNPYTIDARDIMEFQESAAKLARILDGTSSPKKNDMLARLKQIQLTYR